MPVEPGLAAVVELTVTDADTAIAMHSGDVPTLATPRVVALAEEATCAVIAPHVDPAHTSVGARVELSHLFPVPVGATVKAEATVERVEGRRLTFTVSVSSERGLVAAGKVTRVIVNREHFLDRAH